MQPRPVEAAQRRPHPVPTQLTHTINDAAHIVGLSRSTLYRHAAAGRLRLVKVGGRTLVDASSLRALVGAAE
jgi:excisionase family DNA binding protein